MPNAAATEMPLPLPSPVDQVPKPEENINSGKKKNGWGFLVLVIILLLILAGAVYAKKEVVVDLIKVKIPFMAPKPTPTLISQKTPVPSVSDNLSEDHNKFGINLLKEIRQNQGDQNVFISPSSIALALSMVYNGAGGETKLAMEKTLQLQGMSVEKLNQSSANLIQLLTNPDEKVQLAIANCLWGRKGLIFGSEFLADNQKYYSAHLESLDFDLQSSVDTINKWGSDNTRGKITGIVSYPIGPLTVMYLINAVYFKGSWTYEFDKTLTEDKEFNPILGGCSGGVCTEGIRENKPNLVPMMKQTGKDFKYQENDLFQAVALPYGTNKRLQMLVFLPEENLPSLVEKLTYDNWKKWADGFKEKKGTLLLPKFKMEYENQLKPILSKLGMEIAFTDRADFNKIFPSALISEVKHKAYLDISEEGTEAAAVTSVKVGITSIGNGPQPFYMEVNKPFLLAIQDSQTGEILFIGTIYSVKQ